MSAKAEKRVQTETDRTPEARLERAKRMIAAGVSEIVEALRGATEWVDQGSSPLGRRRHCELAREGKLPSRKVGKRILIRREHIDGYIQREGLARGKPPEDEAVDEVLERITKGGGRR